jgi:hypothetical protein
MLAWLQLLRIALAPSILWDCVAGALLAAAAFQAETGVAADIDPAVLLATAVILLCVFHAGMAWNDWTDRAIDRAAGRGRPLADGRLSATAGFGAGLVLFAAALGLTAWLLPNRLQEVTILCGLVAVYDLGGKALRAVAGPVLLALCRILSLYLGMLVVLAPADVIGQSGTWPLLCYGLYVMFLSRLAAREEEGLAGSRAVVPVAACAFAPVVLVSNQSEHLIFVLPAWILFAAWLLRPALADRHMTWSPQRTQAAVRRCLIGMPMIPALALLASPAPFYWAGGGLIAVAASRLLVRRFPPE